MFSGRDHFALADWVMPPDGVGDLDHPNSLDVDRDGDLVVSSRNVGEVSKVDPSGAAVWEGQFLVDGAPNTTAYRFPQIATLDRYTAP